MQPVIPEGESGLSITSFLPLLNAELYLVRGKHVCPRGTFLALRWIDDLAPRCYLYNGGCPFDNPEQPSCTWPFIHGIGLWISTLLRAYPQSCFALGLQQLNKSDCTSIEAFWKTSWRSWGSWLQQSFELITSPCVPSIYPSAHCFYFFLFPFLCARFTALKKRKVPQRRGDGSRDFIILPLVLCLWEAAYLIMPEMHLLLTSFPFNICLRVLS